MKTYTIKQVGEMFQLPASTIRYYEEVGILTHIERNPSGQRIFTQGHINRLKTISCFKHAGMTINQLQRFFAYEGDESSHYEETLNLLADIEVSIVTQIEDLQDSHQHVRKKIDYFSDCKNAYEAGQPLPDWKDYRD